MSLGAHKAAEIEVPASSTYAILENTATAFEGYKIFASITEIIIGDLLKGNSIKCSNCKNHFPPDQECTVSKTCLFKSWFETIVGFSVSDYCSMTGSD